MSSFPLSLRSPMMPGARRIRAYFAPVARDTSTPAAFDLARYGPFVLDSPPPGWVDAGWIQNFTRSAETRTNAVRSGPKAAAIAQFRAQPGNVHVDGACLQSLRLNPPDARQQFVARHRAFAMSDQEREDGAFCLG